MLWRQGDVFICEINEIPSEAIRQTHLVLADGEFTGHQHRVEDFRSAVLYEGQNELFLDVLAERTDVVHQEHGTVSLCRGKYRVWRQREYDPLQRRQFVDVTD